MLQLDSCFYCAIVAMHTPDDGLLPLGIGRKVRTAERRVLRENGGFRLKSERQLEQQ